MGQLRRKIQVKKVLTENWNSKKPRMKLHDAKEGTGPNPYHKIASINGPHQLQKMGDDFCVLYQARRLNKGKVLYFNFDLAKEMGLIPASHPKEMNAELSHTLLKTFCIQIVNEYDILHKIKIDEKELAENQYMVTRYLQMQHPGKKGLTSGDGRSLWNGEYYNRGEGWDITSCGTGATKLSPAVAKYNKFFKTGDPNVSYGCGQAELADGIGAAMMSEMFFSNGLRTERTLLLINMGKGLSINVRAGKNLLRPSHFFALLKQEKWEALQSLACSHILREKMASKLEEIGHQHFQRMLHKFTADMAEVSATFESEYIFCWLDWDGDNILMDGGIIDYGSVRQLGICHHKYRYDDVDRFSTNLLEQKAKARYLVQTFAQLTDFLITKKKTNVKEFASHASLTEFEQVFAETKRFLLLKKVGMEKSVAQKLAKSPSQSHAMKLIDAFQKEFHYFEVKTNNRGPSKVADGVNEAALFSLRALLLELPQMFKKSQAHIPADQFLNIMKTEFTRKKDLALSLSIAKRSASFQKAYLDLVAFYAQTREISIEKALTEIGVRSSLINRKDRITGNASIYLAQRFYDHHNKLNFAQFHQLFDELIRSQILHLPYTDLQQSSKDKVLVYLPFFRNSRKKLGQLFAKMRDIVMQNAHGT